jgi:hypothetical protein
LFVEVVDPEFGDGDSPRDSEFLLGFHLCWKTVAVPPEAALDPLAAHCLVARDYVFDVSGQEMPVVGESVGKWWSVVENELLASALLNRLFEGS